MGFFLRRWLLAWVALTLCLLPCCMALYENPGNDLVVLSAFDDFDQTIVNRGSISPTVWMVHLYEPTENPQHAEMFEFLAKITRGVFGLAIVDVTTETGRHIADYCQASTGPNKAMPSLVLFGEDKGAAIEYTKGWDIQEMANALVSTAVSIIKERSVRFGGGAYQQQHSSTDGSSGAGSEVLEVTQANFEELVLQNPNVVIVAFTAPWCGHCQRLRPEWDQAARQLAGEGADLAWCDATTETQLGNMFNVRGYPTIKVFPGGANKQLSDVTDYAGERTASAIVQGVLAEVDRSGVPKEIEELVDAQTLVDNCSGHNRLCVLAALPHIFDSGAEGRNKYRDVLAIVSKSFRGSNFSFLWFEGTSQPELEQALELTFGFPALVAISMDKQAYAVLHGSFSEKAITSFLHSITTGRQPTIRFEQMPNVVTVTPWDGQDAAPPEEEFSLDDIMGDDDDDDQGGDEL